MKASGSMFFKLYHFATEDHHLITTWILFLCNKVINFCQLKLFKSPLFGKKETLSSFQQLSEIAKSILTDTTKEEENRSLVYQTFLMIRNSQAFASLSLDLSTNGQVGNVVCEEYLEEENKKIIFFNAKQEKRESIYFDSFIYYMLYHYYHIG